MLVTMTPISRPGSLWPAASGDATLCAWACDLAEWRKEIPAQQTSLNLHDGFEEQSGFFEGSGRQNGDSQEKSEQDDEIHGHEEHRILRTRRAFWWPRLTSSRSDRLQATRADWCEGAYLATAGRTGNRCHLRSESLSSISIAGLRQRKTKRIGSSVAPWTSQKYRESVIG